MGPSLDIVIVNWNTGGALRECIESIHAAAQGIALQRVVVVDNASSDDSLALAQAAGCPLVIVRNEENRGFAAACNQGARGSTADYLLFLNPDTRLEAHTLARTLEFMEASARSDVGICGIELFDDRGRSSTVAARFPSLRVLLGGATGLAKVLPRVFPRHLLTGEDCGATREVDQIIGAFFVIRRRLFEALDGFDERFFVYFEEVDLSYRAKQAGYRSMYFAGARAYHRGGLSSEQVRATRLFFSLRSRLLYAFKHFSPARAWLVLALTFLLEGPARLVRAAWQGGGAVAEVSEAYRRLAAFVCTSGWRHDRRVQRAP